MGLSALDLASRFTGWFSLGCSIWSAIPQILLLLRLPSRGGPSFSLLIAWLFGDAALVAGMYLTNAPVTQKFSGIWFGIGDIIIMLLLLVGRSSLGRRYRDRRHSWNSDHSRSQTLVTKHKARKRWWKQADGRLLNAVVGGVLTTGTFFVWYPVDVRDRTTTPPLEPVKAPFDRISWAGWAIGFAGLLCYNVPRWYQIYKIRRNRSMENISLFMFAWLLAQNVTMLASILTVSHSPGAVFGQTPFIANAILALLADIVIIRFYHRYGNREKSAHSPPQVPEPTQAGLESADSVYVLPEVDTGEPLESHNDAYKQAGQLSFHQRLERLADGWQESLSQEEVFHADYALLPWIAREKKNIALDQRAYDEAQRLQDLDAETSGHANKAERRELMLLLDRTSAVRAKLKLLRGNRHRLTHSRQERTTATRADSLSKPRRHSVSSHSDDSQADLLRDDVPATFLLPRMPRRGRSGSRGQRVFYPRRGVGTYRAFASEA